MLLLLVLFTGLSGLQAGQNPRETILQTTIPEKISSPDVETDPENHVAYLITIAEKPYFFHLKKQSFIAPTAVVYTYDKNGVRLSQSLSTQRNCNYNGYVAGFPNSLVALSICTGLRGTIQFQNVSYGIEPVQAMSGFVHVIYENTNEDTEIPDIGKSETYSWFNASQFQVRSSIKKSEFTKLLPRYIEMAFVVDKKLFDYMGSDTKVVTQKVIQVIGLVNTMLSKLKLTVIIHSIEIWSNGNNVILTGKPEQLLIRFFEWKIKYRPQHISYLLVFEEHPVSIGALYPGHVCKPDYDAAVALYPKGLSLESYSVIVLQLLSIGVGLTYDSTETCHCTGDVCLMTPKAIYSGGMKDFSACSLDDYKSLSTSYDLGCLQDRISERQSEQQRPRRICGNGVLEGNEQCDCGTLKNCTHRRCCDPMSCRLKTRAVCGSGECCDQDCKIKPPNTRCRESVDECDFVEYCDGNSSYCVANTYSRDGQYCDSGGAFCYHGSCKTTDKRCMDILGRGVRGAPFWCYEEMNSRGDRFGNCLGDYCYFQNVLCGKLVCTWPYKKLVWIVNMSVAYTQVRDDLCISLYKGGRLPRPTLTTYQKLEDRDETFVEDGTICGPDMFCMETQCKETRFQVDLTTCSASRDCNGHGVCNNFQHCHCDEGFNPPNCVKMEGQFGSIDDGHQYYREGKSYIQPRHGVLRKQWLQLIFYISVPVVVIVTAVVLKQNTKVGQVCDGEGSQSSRSVTEDTGNNTKLTISVRSVSPSFSHHQRRSFLR